MAGSELYGSGTVPVKGDTLRMLMVKEVISTNNGGGGGSGSGAVFGAYGVGNPPNFTPASGTGLAVNTSDGSLWTYYGGAWKQ